jgi:hypothetical protein
MLQKLFQASEYDVNVHLFTGYDSLNSVVACLIIK